MKPVTKAISGYHAPLMLLSAPYHFDCSIKQSLQTSLWHASMPCMVDVNALLQLFWLSDSIPVGYWPGYAEVLG